MLVVKITGLAGFLIILAVTLRAAFSAYAFAGRTMRQTKLEKRAVRQFTTRAVKLIENKSGPQQLSWNGTRKFQIVHRVYEDLSNDICSFYLVPYDSRPIPTYLPGQYLTFELSIPGQPQPVIRCYSLSDTPYEQQTFYRITIKRLLPPPDALERIPPGLSSNFFHNALLEGSIIDVLAPAGEFYLNTHSHKPVVLIAGGVGLTPLISMLNWLVTTRSQREIWFFYGVRDRSEHAMYEHMEMIRVANPNVRMVTFYSHPTLICQQGIDYDIEGFVSVDVIKSMLETVDCEFYICGPPPMMELVTQGLEEWGVPEENIRFEAFGPASVKRVTDRGFDVDTGSPEEVGNTFQVTFLRSGKTVTWNKTQGTILDLAEDNGVKARSGCRAGNCGTCKTALREGEVEYAHRPGKAPEPGFCLPCVGQPKTDIVIDI